MKTGEGSESMWKILFDLVEVFLEIDRDEQENKEEK